MNRDEFDHAIRAAGAVLGETELLVIGSQAVHGTLPEPIPDEAARSVEVDIVPFDDPHGSKADLIDGSIGEASMFHESFGFYAQEYPRPPRCCLLAGGIGSCGTKRPAPAAWWRGASNSTICG